MNCPTCGGPMSPLFSSWFCPRDCDRPRSVDVGPSQSSVEWTGGGITGFPVREYSHLRFKFFSSDPRGDQYSVGLTGLDGTTTIAYPIVGSGWLEPLTGWNHLPDIAVRVRLEYFPYFGMDRAVLEFRRIDGSVYDYTSCPVGGVTTRGPTVTVPLCRVRNSAGGWSP